LPIFGEKFGVFLKTNVMIQFLNNLAMFRVKNADFFAKFFGENILKIITSVPGATLFVEEQNVVGNSNCRLQPNRNTTWLSPKICGGVSGGVR
jgi:hypothetical protein